ncbi:MAG: hypothetical protein JWR26_2742 [Pedosphaera sp.]|nr:hypothetical protein [Pedosphaera sp.]
MLYFPRGFKSSSVMGFLALSLIGVMPVVAGEATNAPDKSQFNLFHPTPEQFMRELSADRPDKTDCPFTVDAGHFQLEMDFANLTRNHPNSERGNVRFTAAEIAPMNIKVGLLNNLDFQLVYTPFRWEKTENRDTGASEQKSGFEGITPRFKWNLVGNDGGFFALALIPFLNLPLRQDHLGPGSIQGGLGIPYSFDIPNWDLGFQSAVVFNRNERGDGHHAEFPNSVSIGHRLIGQLSLSAEFFSSVSLEKGTGWVGTVDTWLTCQISKNVRVDGGVYIGVTPAADDLHFWTGLTCRF